MRRCSSLERGVPSLTWRGILLTGVNALFMVYGYDSCLVDIEDIDNDILYYSGDAIFGNDNVTC